MHPIALLPFRDEIILKTISIWLIVTRLATTSINTFQTRVCETEVIARGTTSPRALTVYLGAPATDGTPYQNPLQRRSAEPHRDLVGAVLCACVAHFIDVTRVAPTHADEVLVGAGVGHRDDHHAVAVDVDVG